MKNKIAYINFAIIVIILLVLNGISNYAYWQFDLTEEKRFTLVDPTIELLKEIDDPIKVEVLLEGQFPAGFKRLQNGVKDVLRQFEGETPYLEIVYVDPNEGSLKVVTERRESLAESGLFPTNLRVNDGTELQEKLIYPYVIFNFANKSFPVNILENSPGFDQEQNLNNSISLLEYKFANALQKILRTDFSRILFTSGRGELKDSQTADLEKELRRFYYTDRVPLDSTVAISPETDLVIVAKPTQKYTDKDLFLLDQYVMQGGRVLWLIDQLDINLDSLTKRGGYIPPPMDHGLTDLFFKYGFRINNDMVLDLECTRIPQVIGAQDGKPQIELVPWYYHTLSQPSPDHPISKNNDRVNMFFPSSIDTVKTKGKVKKTALLRSSEYSRTQLTPTRVNFEILRYKPDPKKFNQPYIPEAYLLEGNFHSLFENKLTKEVKDRFDQIGMEVRTQSPHTKMVVISDGDVAKNLLNNKGRAQPMGYNKWEKFNFPGNSDFILNCVEYLLDDTGLLEARSKNLKLRLLDKVRCENEKSYWQFVNIGLPLFLLTVFGLVFQFVRKRKYTS